MHMQSRDEISDERRARLAAERLLKKKQRELAAANRRLSDHARTLSDQIVEKREEVAGFRHTAEELLTENLHVREDLERAHAAAVRAERRLWDSLEAIRDGFAIYDAQDRLIVANRAFFIIFDGLEDVRPGATYREILSLGMEEGLFNPGEMAPTEWVDWMVARRHDSRIEPVEILLWNDQHIRLVERRTRDGDVVSLGQNITETVIRERELRDATRRAEAASHAKSNFLANMSHEIRTPMNGVVGMADLLADTPLTEEQKLYVETIRSSGEALLVIINDILEFSKIEAEGLTLKPERFDLEQAIHNVLTLLKPVLGEKPVDLVMDYDCAVPTMLMGDAGRIRQILTNLVGNAAKFTETGAITVSVRGRPEGEIWNLQIVVSDTGMGIPKDRLPDVFEEFQQVEEGRARRFEGTGLGLAITRGLVKLMGGQIAVDSEPGVGTTFTVNLPLAASDPVATFHAPPWIGCAHVVGPDGPARNVLTGFLETIGLTTAVAPDLSTACAGGFAPSDVVLLLDCDVSDDCAAAFEALPEAGRPAAVLALCQGLELPEGGFGDGRVRHMLAPLPRGQILAALRELHQAPPQEDAAPRLLRVLAAEDNRTNQLVFRKMVKSFQIELIFAENGAEAVEKFQSFRPDIIFMDISMPIMDGKEAARYIRQIEQEEGTNPIPIVAMTAHAMAGDAEEILASGIDHYLTKPLSRAKIGERLAAVAGPGIEPLTVEPAAATG